MKFSKIDPEDPIFLLDWGFVNWLKYSNPTIVEQAFKILGYYIEKVKKVAYDVKDLV